MVVWVDVPHIYGGDKWHQGISNCQMIFRTRSVAFRFMVPWCSMQNSEAAHGNKDSKFILRIAALETQSESCSRPPETLKLWSGWVWTAINLHENNLPRRYRSATVCNHKMEGDKDHWWPKSRLTRAEQIIPATRPWQNPPCLNFHCHVCFYWRVPSGNQT